MSPYFSFLATLTLISAAFASPAPAAPTTSPTRTNQVIHPSFSDSKCLTVTSNTNNAAVQIEDCVPNAANQLWTITGSTVTIFGDKCLDDTNGNTANGQKLQIYKCNSGNTNQNWANVGLTFKLGGKNKCMDLTDGNRNNGNVVQIYDCTSGGNQKWNVVDGSTVTPPSSTSSIPTTPTGSPLLIVPIKQSETCFTAKTNANNAPVVVEPCDGSPSQGWIYSGGRFVIYGNKCLDVTGGSTTTGTKLQIYTCSTSNTNQQFTLSTPTEFPQAHQIHWKGTNECVDLTDSNLTDGNQMQTWTCGSDNHNQFWYFNES